MRALNGSHLHAKRLSHSPNVIPQSRYQIAFGRCCFSAIRANTSARSSSVQLFDRARLCE